jgi:hypothetical protein
MNKLEMPFGLNIIEKQPKILKAKDIKGDILNTISMLEDDEVKVITHVRLTRMQKAIAEVLKDADYKTLTGLAFEEIAHGANAKKVTLDGSEVSYTAVRTVYDFTSSGHPVLEFLDNVMNRFKDLKKSIEAEIKLIPQESIDVENDFDSETAVTRKVGGEKKILIDSNDVIDKLKFVIDDAQALIDTIESNDGIFVVKAPKIIKTNGLKVLKG